MRSALTRWGLTDHIDDAVVITSELVTNALTHAGTTCEVSVSVDSASLRISVIDEGRGTPDLRPAGHNEEYGRGRYLVAALTAAWGVENIPDDGKLVWAELPRTG